MSKRTIDSDAFIKHLASQFPEIKDEVEDEDYEGLLSLQIGVFRSFTQDAINTKDKSRIARCFEFVNASLGNVDDKVSNSLYLSYLNKLDFTSYPGAKKMLPVDILKTIDAIDKQTKEGEKDPKLRDFLSSLDL